MSELLLACELLHDRLAEGSEECGKKAARDVHDDDPGRGGESWMSKLIETSRVTHLTTWVR
jgi:hypothetical protein